MFRFRKIISVFLAVLTLFSNTVFARDIWVDRRENRSLSRGPKPLASFSPAIKSVVECLPATSVFVEDVGVARRPNAPVVVLMRDVHSNPVAQRNLSAALKRLIARKEIGLVGVEGAFDAYDFSPFQHLQGRAAVISAADSYLDKGGLGAPSHAGLTAEHELPVFIGVDDRESYRKNLDAFLAARALSETLDRSETGALTTKLTRFSLSAEEWEKYRLTRKKSARLRPFENFYEEADIRSRRMVEKLLSYSKQMRTHGASVLFAGGFHSGEMKKMLTRADVSFIVVTPKIGELRNDPVETYLSSLSRDHLKDYRTEITYVPTAERLKAEAQRLIAELDDWDAGHRLSVIRRLGDIGPIAIDSVWKLAGMLRNRDELQRHVFGALIKLGQGVIPHLIWHLRDESNPDRQIFAEALTLFGVKAKDAAPALAMIILSIDRAATSLTLGELIYRGVIVEALQRIGGINPADYPEPARPTPESISMSFANKKINEASVAMLAGDFKPFCELIYLFASPSMNVKYDAWSFFNKYPDVSRHVVLAAVNDAALLASTPAVVEGALLLLKGDDMMLAANFLRHPDDTIWVAAVEALRRNGSDEALGILLRLIGDPSVDLNLLMGEFVKYTQIPPLWLSLPEMQKRVGPELKAEDIPRELSLGAFKQLFVSQSSWRDPLMRIAGHKFGFFHDLNISGPEDLQVFSATGYLTPVLLDAYKSAPDEKRLDVLDAWRGRIEAFSSALHVKDSRSRLGARLILDGPSGEVERDLFIAALRQVGAEKELELAALPPFKMESEEKEYRWMSSLTLDFFEREILKPVTEIADHFFEKRPRIKKDLLPYMVVDYAALMLEPNKHRRVDLKARFWARWKFIARISNDTHILHAEDAATPSSETAPTNDAVTEAVAKPEFADLLQEELGYLLHDEIQNLWGLIIMSAETYKRFYALLRLIDTLPGYSELSTGARSVLRLQAFISTGEEIRDELSPPVTISLLSQKIAEFIVEEQVFRVANAPTAGIELQMFGVPGDDFYGWKSALEHIFLIPSPKRETYTYNGNIEASYNPVYSAGLFSTALPLLEKIMFAGRQRPWASVHQSFSGALGEQAKYIALVLRHFGLNEVFSGDRKGHHESAMWKMSKGIINQNDATVSVGNGVPAPGVRTEIRAARWNGDNSYETWLPAAHLLATALAAMLRYRRGAEDPLTIKLATLWNSYKFSLFRIYSDTSLGLWPLLVADWYEKTADINHKEFVGLLPVIQALDRAADIFTGNPELEKSIRQKDIELFSSYADLILKAIELNAVPSLVNRMWDENPYVRWAVGDKLKAIGPVVIPYLLGPLADSNNPDRQSFALLLASFGADAHEAVPVLSSILDDLEARRQTAGTLSEGDQRYAGTITSALAAIRQSRRAA